LFSVANWANYPAAVRKPKGPFKLIDGREFDAARSAADATNKALHKAHPEWAGKALHHVHPVKLGGSPTDPANIIPVDKDTHDKLNAFWRNIQLDAEGW
jgi:hypothetical protein